MSSTVPSSSLGLPGPKARRYVHLRRTSSRCQRNSVRGLTRNTSQRSLGRSRLAAASSRRPRTAKRVTAHLPAEYLELMAENQEFDVAGGVVAVGQSQCLKQATQAERD